ncbi:hypothetical protein DV738_g2859, partial [Chaetothyriales sp. CBS 135597]
MSANSASSKPQPTPSSSDSADAAKTSKPVSAAGPAILEEDDEFEDFPVEDVPRLDWTQEETEVPGGTTTHLWEESWDDDDENEEFSKQLREELDKTNQSK